MKTGQIDHRTVCGNKFSVKDGVVKEKCLRLPRKGHVASERRRQGKSTMDMALGYHFCQGRRCARKS